MRKARERSLKHVNLQTDRDEMLLRKINLLALVLVWGWGNELEKEAYEEAEEEAPKDETEIQVDAPWTELVLP
ncbi:hypothetical protein J1N35_028739 [Gossypium stocksii]|uniref:Uncharacterized protein n=1 Tax=Gossypium stocksii TaxID=47602 RepID=A0A9D3UWK8_9ROSI|nr:hypothetical protein J1N35_028739 [Gossypium stocksii]